MRENKVRNGNAKTLRKNQTNAESYLWYQLRNRQFAHYKFRRQKNIGPYIVDFVCLHKKLIIELDGSQHLDQKNYDDKRSEFLISQGFKILRYWNNQIFQNTDAILAEIYKLLSGTQPIS